MGREDPWRANLFEQVWIHGGMVDAIEFIDGTKLAVSSQEFAPFLMEPNGLEDRLKEFMANVPLGGFSRVADASFFDAIRSIQGCQGVFGGPYGDHKEVGLYLPDHSKGDNLFLVNGGELMICFGGVQENVPPTNRAVTAHDHHYTQYLPGVLPSEIDLEGMRTGHNFVFTPFGLCRYLAKPKGRPDCSYFFQELRPESVTHHDVLLRSGADYHMDLFPIVLLEHPFVSSAGDLKPFATALPNQWVDHFRREKGDLFFFGEDFFSFPKIAKEVYAGRLFPRPLKGKSIRF